MFAENFQFIQVRRDNIALAAAHNAHGTLRRQRHGYSPFRMPHHGIVQKYFACGFAAALPAHNTENVFSCSADPVQIKQYGVAAALISAQCPQSPRQSQSDGWAA